MLKFLILCMKVIGLLGSPRGKKSYTLKLLESTLSGAQDSGAETEIVDITRKHIGYCKACGLCYGQGKCFQDDDFGEVFDKIRQADGFILASPVYFSSVTAQLKTFMDRTSFYRHCFTLSGKYGLAVVTTASSGVPETFDLIDQYVINLGAFSTGGVSVKLPVMPANMDLGKKEAYKAGKDLADAIVHKRQYPEQTAVRESFLKVFKNSVKYNKDLWKAEYEH